MEHKMSSEFFDTELLAEFVNESIEHLDAIEPDLIALEVEENASNQETINRIFRAIHSIKGGAGFLAFNNLKQLSHKMETVLMSVRDGELRLSPGLNDSLLKGVDVLRSMLNDVANSESVDCTLEMAALDKIVIHANEQESKHVLAHAAKPQSLLPHLLEILDCDVSQLKQQHPRSHHLYLITLTSNSDNSCEDYHIDDVLQELMNLGVIIGKTNLTIAQLAKEKDTAVKQEINILYSTVLETDLVAHATGLECERIKPLDKECSTYLNEKSRQIVDSSLPISDKEYNEQSPSRTASDAETHNRASLESHNAADDIEQNLIITDERAASPALKTSASSIHRSNTDRENKTQETIRVKVELVGRLMNNAGELVLARNQLLRAMAAEKENNPELAALLQNLDTITTELQEGVMMARMQPLGTIYSKFNRVVRDLSKQLGKDIDLQITGGDVELDKSMLELLADPMTHLIRNAIDHGIETPSARFASGKPSKGTLTIASHHRAGYVTIQINDDGAGIDASRLVRKAVSVGKITKQDAERLTQSEALELIFMPGLSTAEKVSDLSGRGVGMDVVKTNIEQMGGSISIESAIGTGTTIKLDIPLTLAIIPCIVVNAEQQHFAIPQASVTEFVWIGNADIKDKIVQFHGEKVLKLRGQFYPLVDLAETLRLKRPLTGSHADNCIEERRARLYDRRSQKADDFGTVRNVENERIQGDRRTSTKCACNILLVRAAGHDFGIIVDTLREPEEIVVKPVPKCIGNVELYSGVTILGDGSVTLILDVAAIASAAALRMADVVAGIQQQDSILTTVTSGEMRTSINVLLLNSAERQQIALVNENILRIACMREEDVQWVEGSEMVQLDGLSYRIKRIENLINVNIKPAVNGVYYLVIPRFSSIDSIVPKQALVLTEVPDSREISVNIEDTGKACDGIIGTAIVDNLITTFVNVTTILNK
jgi:two-component system chemotaxis sensor kinase CheA